MDQEIYNFLLECKYEVADTESEEDVAELEQYFESKGALLPPELKDIYLEIGPGGGVYKDQPFSIWTISLVLDHNKRSEQSKIWRRYLLFGSDCGSAGFAFDTQAEGLPVVMVEMIGLSKPSEARLNGNTFKDFLLNGIDTATHLD